MHSKWIGYIDKKYLKIDKKAVFGAPAQYYRKQFYLKSKPEKAFLRASALGIFKAFINGKSVSDELFAPGWTNYNKKILYREYDVTHLLDVYNGISFCVGDGWYAGYISIKGRKVYGEYPLAIWAELECHFADGSVQRIVTDESWTSGEGAVRQNDFLCGEIYDDRLPHEETSNTDFIESGWNKVVLTEDKTDLLAFCDYEPIMMQESFLPVLVCKKGKKAIYDFGQNFAGIVTIKAVGKRGSKIVVRHAEVLTEDNRLYVENLRIAKATDTLILNDREKEYTPSFTYHGFRYIEVSEIAGAKILAITGRAIHNRLESTGKIETDNEIVNKIISNTIWGMKSNFVDIPTDCPQRNERLGWTADTQVFSRSACYFANCEKFYNKYLSSINDDRQGGCIPDIIPFFGIAGFDRPFWRDAAVVIPYNLFEMYGNTVEAKKQLPMIKDFLDRQISTSEGFIWKDCFYNDWLNLDEQSPDDVLSTAINAYVFKLGIFLLKELGEDYFSYQDFLYNVENAFKKNFIDGNGEIRGGTQTVYALSYRAGLIDGEQAKNGLIKCFAKRNNHIHSGFCGIRFILPTLCDVGLSDLAYELISKTSFPSWGYSILNGATTMWERWDGYVKGKGFGDSTMNSFNHYAFGSCGEWFFEYMLGIKPKKAGFKQVSIRPFVDRSGRIKKVSGSYKSVRGTISVSWQSTENGFVCEVEKPQNLFALFDFENVLSVEQGGKKVKDFSPDAKHTKIVFI